MTPRRLISILLLLTVFVPARGQDIHFSQIDVNPVLFNPAYSGFFDGQGRFGGIYRNQWASVSKAFQTIAATAECSLMRRRYYGDGLSLGTILYSDRAGTLHYGTTAGNLILSYFKSVGRNRNSSISAAAEVGFGQAGFNNADIILEDPTDDFAQYSKSFFTIGAGLAWFYQPNDDLYFKAGIAARNINRPDISYMMTDSTFIERKFSLYARSEYRAWGDISLMPLVAAVLQNNYREAIVGCDVKWYLSESSTRTVSFSWGIHYRWRDAALVEMTAEYNAFLFALSYDANLSKLTPASHSLGAFEISIVYRLARNTRVRRTAMPCPIM
ncbi:MAG: PorP/SprF family type IX secretion system membrane protein [Bacteroidales bacterium]|nr:PorP/SprF family type IX secretion system membrane protein [Bacteroidales bacterium]